MLTILFRRLRPFVRYTGTHGHAVLAAALLLSLACAPLALRLEIDAELSNLLPSEYPTIRALERLRETIGGEDDVAVADIEPGFRRQSSLRGNPDRRSHGAAISGG